MFMASTPVSQGHLQLMSYKSKMMNTLMNRKMFWK